jgi:hypothetical protein
MIGIRTARGIVAAGFLFSLFLVGYYSFAEPEPARTIFYLACALMAALLWNHPETLMIRSFEEFDLGELRTLDYIMLGTVLVLMSTSGLVILLG